MTLLEKHGVRHHPFAEAKHGEFNLPKEEENLEGLDVHVVDNNFYQDAFDRVSFGQINPWDGWLMKTTE